eukprot:9503980-Pyramimonas_sp.AAC.1
MWLLVAGARRGVEGEVGQLGGAVLEVVTEQSKGRDRCAELDDVGKLCVLGVAQRAVHEALPDKLEGRLLACGRGKGLVYTLFYSPPPPKGDVLKPTT